MTDYSIVLEKRKAKRERREDLCAMGLFLVLIIISAFGNL